MADKRIDNPNVPYKPEPQRDEEGRVDPEKFKKILKVDASDEPEKKRKRRTHKEEEHEDEDVESPVTPPDGERFSSLMEEDDGSSIFDPQSPGKRLRKPADSSLPYQPPKDSQNANELTDLPEPSSSEETLESALESPLASEDEQDASSGMPPDASLEESSSLFPLDEDASNLPPSSQIPPPAASSQENKPVSQSTSESEESKQEAAEPKKSQPSSSASNVSPEQSASSTPGKTSKKSHTDSSLLASQPEQKALRRKKKTKATAESQVMEVPMSASPQTSMPLDQKKPADEEQALQEIPESAYRQSKKTKTKKGDLLPAKKPRQKAQFRRITSQVQRKQTQAFLKENTSTDWDTAQRKKWDASSALPFPEATQENASIPLPPSPELLPPAQWTDMPAYTKLSSQTYELFERLGGVMVVQAHAGITKTTVTLHMPDSIFDRAEVVLDRYSTAPHAFNLQLIGSPEAVQAFSHHIDELSQAFKDAQYNFEVNILSPILQTKAKKPLIHRKASAGGGGDQKGRQNQK